MGREAAGRSSRPRRSSKRQPRGTRSCAVRTPRLAAPTYRAGAARGRPRGGRSKKKGAMAKRNVQTLFENLQVSSNLQVRRPRWFALAGCKECANIHFMKLCASWKETCRCYARKTQTDAHILRGHADVMEGKKNMRVQGGYSKLFGVKCIRISVEIF